MGRILAGAPVANRQRPQRSVQSAAAVAAAYKEMPALRRVQLLVLLLSAVSTASAAPASHVVDWEHSRSPVQKMVDVVNRLGLTILKEHNYNNENNIALSPYGVASILTVLLEGVSGHAALEIQRCGGFPHDKDLVRVGLRDIHRLLRSYFIPREGFLSGLSLSSEKVSLRPEYQSILRFYGFDLTSFNTPIYSQSETSATTVRTNASTAPPETRATTATTSAVPPETRATPATTSAVTSITAVASARPQATTWASTATVATPKTTRALTTEVTTLAMTATIIRETTTPFQTTDEASTFMTTRETTTPVQTTEAATTPTRTTGETTTPTQTTEETTTPTQTTEETTTPAQTTKESTTLPTTAGEEMTSTQATTETTTEERPMTLTTADGQPTATTASATEPTAVTTAAEAQVTVTVTATEGAATAPEEPGAPPATTEATTARERRSAGDHHGVAGRAPHSFLVQGRYEEPNVMFMSYDVILPFVYVRELDALALRFPLDSPRYYLLLVLPADQLAVDALICDLGGAAGLTAIVAAMKPTYVRALIPSFALRGFVVLTPSLQRMGIRQVFEPRRADFSPMTADANVYVTNIEQAITVTIKNYVDAAGAADAAGAHLYRYAPVEFRATHPFLYFVMDAQIDVALVAGKIVNPINSRIQ